MSWKFTKMHGCGNDFLFFDAMQSPVPQLSSQEITALCDRNFGPGADGLAMLKPGDLAEASWEFYNCDGTEAEMCGNAARCAVHLLATRHFPNHQDIRIETAVGIVSGKVVDNELVEIQLASPAGQEIEFEEKFITVDEKVIKTCNLNTGVPHAVIEVEDIHSAPIAKIGKSLVGHAAFGKSGTNVTFFQKKTNNEIFSTTFERGVEKQTFACGTGVVAAALVFSQIHYQPLPIRVRVPGGILEVNQDKNSRALKLRGPVAYVMEVSLHKQFESKKARSLFGRSLLSCD